MKPATYTQEQIIDAARQLLEHGKRVTPFGIRNILGGGNPARIKAILEANQNAVHEGQVVVASVPNVELPTEFVESLASVKEGLEGIAKQMYARAHEVAESRVKESIATARQAQELAEAEVREAMQSVEQVDAENARLQEHIDQLQAELVSQRDTIHKLEKESVAQGARSDTLATQQREALLQVQEMDRINATLKASMENMTTQLAQAQKQLSESQQDTRTAREEAAQLRGQLIGLEGK